MAAQPIAAMAECRPASPTGTHKLIGTIASSSRRDSAASGRQGIACESLSPVGP
jgi:hypothetical protein